MAAPSDAATLGPLWTVILSLLGSGVLSAIVSAIAGGRAARRQSDATVESARVAAEATVRSALSAAGSDSRRLQYELMRRRVEMFDSVCLDFLTATRSDGVSFPDSIPETDEIEGAAMLVCGQQWNQISPKWDRFLLCAVRWLASLNHDQDTALEALKAQKEQLGQRKAVAVTARQDVGMSKQTLERLGDMRSALFELCSAVDKTAMDRIACVDGPDGGST